MNETRLKQNNLLTTLTLFTSASTLICCAMPALFVTLGAGAALAGLVSNVPQLVWFTEHKQFFFLLSGILLLGAGIMQWRARSLPCPADPALAAACTRTRKAGLYLYLFSLFIYAVGVFFAYVAPYVLV